MTWWQTILVSALGGVVSLSLKWLFDFTFHRIKVRGEKETLVHRVQFEKEFTSYVDIWRHVPDIQSFVVSHDFPMTPDYEERRKKELPALRESMTTSIAQAEPFLHPDVLSACASFLRANEAFSRIDEKFDKFSESVDGRARTHDGNISARDQKCGEDYLSKWYDALQKVADEAEGIQKAVRSRIWDR